MNVDKTLILKKIKQHLKYTKDVDFADFLGISPQTLASWYTRNTFDLEVLYAKFIDVSPDWLLTGQGNMLRNDCTPTPTAQECPLCQEKDKLIQALQTTVDTQATLISYLQESTHNQH